MPRFARDTTKHSPRRLSPHIRHSSYGAFQRDSNATCGIGITRCHSPTAHPFRKHMHARSAPQVAGASQSVDDDYRLSNTSMFTDSKRETQLRINSDVDLAPKPMSYAHRMHFVQLEHVLFSQTDISLQKQDKPNTINEMKCNTSKIKLVFTHSTVDTSSGDDAAFDVYIIGFFGKEEEMKNGTAYAPAPQIPAMEVVRGAGNYISVNNRRLHAIHSLLYALSRDYTDNTTDPKSAYTPNNGQSIMYSVETFRRLLLDLYQIKVNRLFCPVIVHEPDDSCPPYVNDGVSITWHEFLKTRFRRQRGCCDPNEFKENHDSCPDGKPTYCDSGIVRIPTFKHMIGEIYQHPERESRLGGTPDSKTRRTTRGKALPDVESKVELWTTDEPLTVKGDEIPLDVTERTYYQWVMDFLRLPLDSLFTDDVVIIDGSVDSSRSAEVYARVRKFQENAKCYPKTHFAVAVQPTKSTSQNARAQKQLKKSMTDLKNAQHRGDAKGIEFHSDKVDFWRKEVDKEVAVKRSSPKRLARTSPKRSSPMRTRSLSDDHHLRPNKSPISKRTAINALNRKEKRPSTV